MYHYWRLALVVIITTGNKDLICSTKLGAQHVIGQTTSEETKINSNPINIFFQNIRFVMHATSRKGPQKKCMPPPPYLSPLFGQPTV
jgi:hypothetical protein